MLATFCLYASCNLFSKNWDKIYENQQTFFRDNESTFALAATILDTSAVSDTSLLIFDKYLKMPDTLISKLRNIGIKQIDVYKGSCETKDIRFVPDSLWDCDRFSVMQIQYNRCDKRSEKGYHWTMNGSNHKHSFGQGNGWFIYSDSDPF